MKKSVLSAAFLFMIALSSAQVRDYNPQVQPTERLQYFKPVENHLFPGDCMPYNHNGTFYLYWLLDEGHHSGLGGLGGHQWALSTSEDLVHWKHYPVALGIDEEWEKSICTGSVIVEDGKFYAFYSTRVVGDGRVQEQLSYAISEDGGKTYIKQQPNPFYTAPAECVSRDFRDPKVFKDKDGKFHLFVSGYRKSPEISGFGGYLVHLVSDDLKNWTETVPVLDGQVAVPECSDYFEWNGWYYLIYSTGSDTYYVMSRKPYGPWQYPPSQPFVESWANVYKTALANDGRRIAVAFIPGKWNNKDNEGGVFGGNILFREVGQKKDGTLYTRFLPEVLPRMIEVKNPVVRMSDKNGIVESSGMVKLDAANGTRAAFMENLPENYRLTMDVVPRGNYDEIGLFLRASVRNNNRGYKFELNANKRLVLLQNTLIYGVDGLDKPVKLDIIVKGDIIDANIDGRRCIVNRLPEQKGRDLYFFTKNGNSVFKNIRLYKIEE